MLVSDGLPDTVAAEKVLVIEGPPSEIEFTGLVFADIVFEIVPRDPGPDAVGPADEVELGLMPYEPGVESG